MATAFNVERFARVYTKGPEELPAQADTYHDAERGWYFKLHLDGITTRDAQPVIEKAADHFVVELVERMHHGEVYKERVYVESPDEVPEGFKVHTGPKGGLYYESGVQRVGSEGGEERDVAVIHWDDVEEGDDIVYETPEGEETFAEIVSIEERGDRADVIYVSIDGESQRAMPGTYTVDKSDGVYVPLREKRPPEVYEVTKQDTWTFFVGPNGGEGWYNLATGEKRYQQQRPGEAPEGGDGYGDWVGEGWEEAPEDITDLQEGQTVEFFTEGEYHEGRVDIIDEDGEYVKIDTHHEEPNGLVMADGSGDELTAVEEVDDNFAFEDGEPVHIRTDHLEQDHPEYMDYTGTIEPKIHNGEPLYGVVDENGTVIDEFWEDELRGAMVDQAIPEGAVVDIEWDESDHPIEAEVEWTDGELGFRVSEGMYEGAWVHSDEVHNSDDLVADGSDEEGDDDIPPEEQAFLDEYGIEVGTSFNHEGNEVIVTGATSMGGPDKDYVEVYIPSTEAHLPLHPNTVPDHVKGEDAESGSAILGEIETEIDSLDGGDEEGAESPPEDEEPEADTTTPDEDEMDDAVAQPAPEDAGGDGGPTADYDMNQYDDADVEEWGSLSEFGFPGGITAHAMSVGALPEYDDTNESPENNAGLVFKTEFSEGSDGAKPGLGLRQMVTHDVGQMLDARMPTHVGHPTEDGYVVAEGVDGKMAQDVEPGVVDHDDFMEQAAKQVILGNNDAHSQNVLVDPDGKVWAIDIDHSAGDMMDGFVGNKTWYGDAIDRATGELVDTAESLGLDVSQQDIVDRAEEVAAQYVDDESVNNVLLDAAQAYDTEMAQNVENNLHNFANGSITLEEEL